MTSDAVLLGPVTTLFLRGRRQDRLAEEDVLALEGTVDQVKKVPARQKLMREGQRVVSSTLLLEGFMCRYMDDRRGYRQLVAIHVPGDFVDLHGLPMERLDHDLATLTPCRVATWQNDVLENLALERPRLMRSMWFSTLLDAAMYREWIFRLGRLEAEGRIAHLMCELEARLEMVGLADDGRFALPLKQSDIAEACGLTGVHVNRVLRSMRERELLLFQGGEVTILDRRELCTVGQFDPAYLYGDDASSPPFIARSHA